MLWHTVERNYHCFVHRSVNEDGYWETSLRGGWAGLKWCWLQMRARGLSLGPKSFHTMILESRKKIPDIGWHFWCLHQLDFGCLNLHFKAFGRIWCWSFVCGRGPSQSIRIFCVMVLDSRETISEVVHHFQWSGETGFTVWANKR